MKHVKRLHTILGILSLVICSILVLSIVLTAALSNNSGIKPFFSAIFDFFQTYMGFNTTGGIFSLIPASLLFLFMGLSWLGKRDTLLFWWKAPLSIVIFLSLYLLALHLRGSDIDLIVWNSIKSRNIILSSIFVILAVLLEISLFVLFNNISIGIYIRRQKKKNFEQKVEEYNNEEITENETIIENIEPVEEDSLVEPPIVEEINREKLEEKARKPLVFPKISSGKRKVKKEAKVIETNNNNMATRAASAALKEKEQTTAPSNTISLKAFENIKKEFINKEAEKQKIEEENEKKDFIKASVQKSIEKENKKLLEEQEKTRKLEEELEKARQAAEKARKEKEKLEAAKLEAEKAKAEAEAAIEEVEAAKIKAIAEAKKQASTQPVLPVVDKTKIEPNKIDSGEEKSATAYLLNQDTFKNYRLPKTRLLKDYPYVGGKVTDEVKENGQRLVDALAQFNIDVTLVNIMVGPTVTLYELEPGPKVKITQINNLLDNLAMNLATAHGLRLLAPIPGKRAVGIEVANKDRAIIGFKDLVKKIEESELELPCILGKDITGTNKLIDIAKTPHLLVAGATGSGKSVCINSLLCSLLFARRPDQVKLILVDPKVVELSVYNGIGHLLTPVITEPKKAIKALQWAVDEMERRYELLGKMRLRNIVGYNKKIKEDKIVKESLPYIVFVIDEFADIMATSGSEIEVYVARLAAKARAVGIHLVLATQRPDKNVVTGLIKSNLPTKISFMVGSSVNSRIIIDEIGAEKLLGRGDMLLKQASQTTRIQGCFLDDEEVVRIVDYIKRQGEPEYLDESLFEDELPPEDTGADYIEIDADADIYVQALQLVIQQKKASASLLQRRLKLGFARASRLIDRMEDEGVIGPNQGSSKPREILRIPEGIIDEY